MLPDDADDLLANVTEFVRCHKKLGEVWVKHRGDFYFELELYERMPNELVDMLDEMSGVVRCEEADCRALCHGDWDFCKEHGERMPDEKAD